MDFDLIVSDVMLATGKTGPTLVRAIREQQPNIPCLFISGYKQGALSEDDLAVPNTDFLAKPFTKASFTERISRLMNEASDPGSPFPTILPVGFTHSPDGNACSNELVWLDRRAGG